MARGVAARNRRRSRRAARGAESAQPFAVSLDARREARAARAAATADVVPAAASATLSRLEARRAARLAASGAAGLPLGPRNAAWDAAAADKATRAWADATEKPNAKYASAFFYKDTTDGGADAYGDYKLQFAEPEDGTLTANWGGVTAVAGALQGARGGVDIPAADKTAIRGKVEGYYAKARTQYKDDSIKAPWAADKAAGETEAYLLAYAQLGPDADPAVMAVATVAWEEQFAAMGACANCGDAYSMHLGDSGPCTAEGCDCNGYDQPDADGDGGDLAAAYEPSAGLELALRFLEEEGAPAREYVRVRLSQFEAADDGVSGTIPDQHRPGARQPRRNPSPKVPPTPASGAVEAGPRAWSCIMAPEGKLTSDGRAFAPGAVTWRELPLTLSAMVETSEGGHVGATVCGRIDRIWRDEAAGLIRAQGVFAETDYGCLIACAAFAATPEELGYPELTASLVADQTLRGISVDLAISNYVTGPRSDWFDEDGNWAPREPNPDEPTDILKLYSDDTIAVVLAAEIGMTTVCPFPAFAEAKIAMGDSLAAGANPAFWTVTAWAAWEPVPAAAGDAVSASAAPDGSAALPAPAAVPEALTASGEGLAPVAPPAAWFGDPQLDRLTPLTITDEGRVYGHAFDWVTPHIGLPGQHRTAPHSQTGYRLFHLGEVVCDDGSRVTCGQVTLDTGHAARGLETAAVIRHYDDTGTVVAHVVMGEDEHGGWVAGAVQPDVAASKVRLARGAKLSGDWRKHDGHLELCALLCVNVPGFPIPRATAELSAAAAGEEPEIVSLVAAGIPIFEEDLSPQEWEHFKVLRDHARFAELGRRAA